MGSWMPARIEAFTSVRIFEAILPKVENPGSSSPAPRRPDEHQPAGQVSAG